MLLSCALSWGNSFPPLYADDEAKRKKHRLRDCESTRQMHAAQIYAEMLGQVCHKGLYTANPNGFQEVKLRF